MVPAWKEDEFGMPTIPSQALIALALSLLATKYGVVVMVSMRLTTSVYCLSTTRVTIEC